ncbi:MAG: nucleotide exchange factor GrpE [Nitrospinae bacterium]|nr:nucleotide exchange factor GrpE [Nitrospinota bacterium]
MKIEIDDNSGDNTNLQSGNVSVDKDEVAFAEDINDEKQTDDLKKRRLEKKELPRKKEDEITELKEEIRNLREELLKREEEFVGAKDQAMRAVADADNYKKRLAREKEDFEKYAAVPFIRSLLSVMDNLENALKAVRDGGDASKLAGGVELTHRQMLDTMKGFGLERLEVVGKPLDPMLCEVIQIVEDAAREDGTVVAEFIAGYRFKDRVIRTAKVKVTKCPEEPQSATDGEETTATEQ